MFAGTALSVRLLVYAGLSLFIINGPYVYVVVCVVYAYNLTLILRCIGNLEWPVCWAMKKLWYIDSHRNRNSVHFLVWNIIELSSEWKIHYWPAARGRKFLLWLCKVVIISITNSMYRHSCHCTTYILLKVHNLKLLHIITHDFEVGIDSILEFSMDWKLDKNQILPLSVSNLFLLNYP